jgi:hypothetical protein
MVLRSRFLGVGLLFLLSAILAGISTLAAQEVLTNAAIVEMVKARLSDQVIVTQIQDNPGNYSLGHEDLISLKSQGVSDKILAAMQAKVRQASGGSEPQSAMNRAEAGSAPARVESHPGRTREAYGIWQPVERTDPMSGEKHFEADRLVRVPDAAGDMKMVATCDAVSVQMTFTYLANDNQTGFKENTEGAVVVPNNLLGAVIAAGRHSRPWVDMRVRIDNDPPVTVSFENDYPNQASLMFFADPRQASTGQALSESDPVGGTVASMLLAGKSAGSRDKAVEAQSILVEFTLADGRNEIVQIEPQQAGFQEFAYRCDDEFWTGPARRKAEEEAKKKAAEEAYVREFTGAKNNAVLGIQQPHGPAADGFKFLYSLSWPDRKYDGTVEQFAKDFPEFFKRAVLASGLDISDIDGKIAYIVDAVRRCAQITPELEKEKGAFEPNGRPLWGGRVGGTETLEKLGPEYGICKKAGPVPPVAAGFDFAATRVIDLSITPVGDRWLDRKAFIAQVGFSQLAHDADGMSTRLQPGADYAIIFATIHP